MFPVLFDKQAVVCINHVSLVAICDSINFAASEDTRGSLKQYRVSKDVPKGTNDLNM